MEELAYTISALMVHFSPSHSGRLAAAGLEGNDFTVWDVDRGEEKRRIAGCRFAVFSSDGRTIATVSSRNTHEIQLVRAKSGAVRVKMAGGGQICCASFSVDDGSKLATGNCFGECMVWDSSTGALLRTIYVSDSVDSLAWGRDWVQATQRVLAFAMGQHPRLGEGSHVLPLDAEVVRMILDRV